MKQINFFTWLCLILVFEFLLLVGIIGTNYFIDAHGYFGPNRFNFYVAKDVLDGNIFGNLSYRKFQLLMIKNIDKTPHTIVLGSSRATRVRQHYLNNKKTFLNNAVNAAILEDYIATLGIYKTEKKQLPKNIILSLDPALFDETKSKKLAHHVLSNYYKKLISDISLNNTFHNTPINWQDYKELFKLDYLNINTSLIKKIIFKKCNLSENVVRQGNSFQNWYKLVENSKAEKQRRAKQSSRTSFEFCKKHFSTPQQFNSNGYNTKLFEDFIAYLKKNNVAILFFLHPFHPIAYKYFMKNRIYNTITEVEQYLINFAKTQNIPVLGSYNPNHHNFTAEDFEDALHGSEKVTKKIFKHFRHKGKNNGNLKKSC